MPKDKSEAPSAIIRGTTLRIARFYVLISFIWIIGTDGLVYLHGGVNSLSTMLSIGKGLAFVLVTAIVLYAYVTRRLRQSFHESETLRQRLLRLSRFANDIILLSDQHGRILDANDRAVEAYGYPIEILRRMTLGDLCYDDHSWRTDLGTVLEKGDVRFETLNKRADGSIFPVEVSARRMDLDGDTTIQGIVRDITERKTAERQIIRLKDVYAALSQTNQSLIRLSNREELFQAICDICIQYGHFRMACIGLIDPDSEFVSHVVKSGQGVEYLDGIRISTDPTSPLSHGPVGRAITSGHFQVVNDFERSENTRPWHQRALKFRFKSSAAFPVFEGDRIIGTLSLYSEEGDYFTQDLIDLLCEMTIGISHALDRMESEKERRRLELALKSSNARTQGIIEGSRDIIAAIDADLRFTLCNKAYGQLFLKNFGKYPAPGIMLADAMRSRPEELKESSAHWKRALEGESLVRNWAMGEGNGQIFFESHFTPLSDPDGNIVGAFHIGRDITAHRKMESDLRKLSTAVEQSPVTVVITDRNGLIEYVNPAFTTTSGYTAEEALGQNPRFMKSGVTRDAEYATMWRSILGGIPWVGQFHNKRKDGSLFWEEAVIAPIRDATGTISHFIAIKQDVTMRREAEERAAFLAVHDPLTKLPNRRLGKERMEKAMKNAERMGCMAALLFIDIDHFKKVNDSLGHAVGDHLLEALVERLQNCIRPSDTLSRLGGDEFLLIVPSFEDPFMLHHLAERILEKIVKPFSIDGFELSITVSIGVAVYLRDGQDFGALFAQADTAMYHAKKAGRNTYQFFTEKMKTDANEYLLILNGLRRGLDRSEFVLYYQPQIELATNNVVGAEALIRWNHPDLRLVSPDRFISIAEDSGLIVEIGEWVMKQACRQAARWKLEGKKFLPVSVNLSAIQFRRGNLIQVIDQALGEAQLDPSLLELELTESILIEDSANARSLVQQLKALGVRLSLDDFGTGYSNLAYLKRFHLDKLKIDRSFVSGITTSHDDETLVQTIIQMAQTFGLKTVAEGVETVETLELIRQCGCDQVQGYYFAKPMPPDEFEVYLASREVPVSR